MKRIFIVASFFIFFIFSLQTFVFVSDDDFEIGKEIINKYISNSISIENERYNSLEDFNIKIKKSESIYVPLNLCSYDVVTPYLGLIKSEIINNDGIIDAIDDLDIVKDKELKNIIDNFEKVKYNNIRYIVNNDYVYVNLNDFKLNGSIYELIIDNVIFRIDSKQVPLTYQNYINQVLKNKNNFKLNNIIRDKNTVIYEFIDLSNDYIVNIKRVKNLMGRTIDICIEDSFILNGLGVCKIMSREG